MRELTVFSVLYDVILSLDTKLGLYMKESVSGISSVVEEVGEAILMTSIESRWSYTVSGLAREPDWGAGECYTAF